MWYELFIADCGFCHHSTTKMCISTDLDRVEFVDSGPEVVWIPPEGDL